MANINDNLYARQRQLHECSPNFIMLRCCCQCDFTVWFAAVKLNSLVIKSSETKGKGPRSIRLFKNTPSIGFGEAENAPSIQDFVLTEKDLEGEALTLRSCNSIEHVSCCDLQCLKHGRGYLIIWEVDWRSLH